MESEDYEPFFESLRLLAETDDIEPLLHTIEETACSLLPGVNCAVILTPSLPGPEHTLRIPLTNLPGESTTGWLVAEGQEHSPAGLRKAAILSLIASAAIRRASLQKRGTVKLDRLNADNDTMIRDLVFARQILTEMLPRENLESPNFSVAARLEPAERVGGDCFNYVSHGGHIHFMLADAVGHGLGSTLLVFECRAAWRALSLGQISLGERVRLLNEQLYENTGPERFVACCVGTIEESSGDVEVAICGISPLFVHQARNDQMVLYEDSDPPLGLFPDLVFQVQTLRLEENDCMTIVTDGVLDWHEPAGEFFGEARLATLLSHCAALTPTLHLESIFAHLRAFGGTHGQRDDACALVIQRHGEVSRVPFHGSGLYI